MTRRIRVVAEAGTNHNGSLELALQLIEAAAAAGADAVKFQVFQGEVAGRPARAHGRIPATQYG